MFLFEDPVSSAAVQSIQHACTQFSISPGTHSDPMSPLVPDEKIILGLIASHPFNKTVHNLGKTYNHSNVDVATIAREVCTCMCACGGGGGDEEEGGRGEGQNACSC